MRVRVLDARALPEGVIQAWLEMHRQPAFASPYYHPGWTQTMARVRSDVCVALGEQGGRIVFILPFHAHTGRARAVGEYLNDYQGPLFREEAIFSMTAMLRAINMRYWAFDHVPADRAFLHPYAWSEGCSKQIDLSAGVSAYREEVTRQHSQVFKKLARAERKFEQEVGPLRFTFESHATADFDALLIGKSAQYQRTRAVDIFTNSWVRDCVNDLFQQPEISGFRGLFSTLHAGEQLIAAHFGLRSGATMHYWFPWYDPCYATYSVGLILLSRCIDAAGAAGIETLDLGCGDQAYKLRFSNRERPLIGGACSRPMIGAQAMGLWYRAQQQLRTSAAWQYARVLKRRLQREGE